MQAVPIGQATEAANIPTIVYYDVDGGYSRAVRRLEGSIRGGGGVMRVIRSMKGVQEHQGRVRRNRRDLMGQGGGGGGH